MEVKPDIKLVSDIVSDYSAYRDVDISDVVHRHIVTISLTNVPICIVSALNYISESLYPTYRFVVDTEKNIITDNIVIIEDVCERLRSLHISSEIEKVHNLNFKLNFINSALDREVAKVKSHMIQLGDGDKISNYINNVELCMLRPGEEINIEGKIVKGHSIEQDLFNKLTFCFARDVEETTNKFNIWCNTGTITIKYVNNIAGKDVLAFSLKYIHDLITNLVDNIETELKPSINGFYVEIGDDSVGILANVIQDLIHPELGNYCGVSAANVGSNFRLTFKHSREGLIKAFKNIKKYADYFK